MAVFRIFNAVAAGFIDVFQTTSILSSSSTSIAVLNSDGTITTISGSGFTLSGNVATAGSITSFTRVDATGTVTLETATLFAVGNNSLASFWNAPDAVSRQVYLTSQNDVGQGSAGNDVFNLGAGGDNFTGFAGNDTFIGGTGFDFINYTGEQTQGGTTQGVIVNLSASSVSATITGGTFTVAAGSARDSFGFTDTLTGIEAVGGTVFNDAIFGSSGNDSFLGFAGNDFIDGGAGRDAWNAYSSPNGATGTVPTQGMVATYAAGAGYDGIINNDGFGTSDTFVSIESIVGTAFADTFNGNAANNVFFGLAGDDTFLGGDGLDEVAYNLDANYGGTLGVDVNLATGVATDGFGTIDTLNSIEWVIGTDQADRFTGSSDADTVFGLGGNDVFVAGDGLDVFIPGAGADTYDARPGSRPDMSFADNDVVDYSDGTNGVGVIVNLSTAAVVALIGAGGFVVAGLSARDWSGSTDSLIDVERVRGTNQDDYFRGSDLANLRQELFIGLGGSDYIAGGFGQNVAAYNQDSQFGGTNGAIVNLSAAAITGMATGGSFVVDAGHARDGFGATDTLINITGAAGTAFNDYFVGNAGDNSFQVFGGNDFVDGGEGDDHVSVFIGDVFTGAGATVDLTAGTATSISGGFTTLVSIENVEGSSTADTIIGSVVNNRLDGGIGDDIIKGMAGDDTLIGGPGNNSLDGGDGTGDTVSYLYDPNQGQVLNQHYAATFPTAWTGVTVNLATHSATNYAGGTDSLTNIENVVGTFLSDSLTGDAADNWFDGLSGNDTIDGGAGVDTIYYGAWGNSNLPGIAGSAPRGVTVSLADNGAGTATDGEGGTDTLISIENVIGGNGNDTITGNQSDNRLDGGLGNNIIFGGGGHDVISCVNGQNTMVGNADIFAQESDTLLGGIGNDTIYGEFTDIIDGGSGQDFLYAVNSFNWSIDLGATYIEWMFAGFGDDVINASSQTAGVEIYGSGGNDTLTGSAQNDFLWAGVGNDVVVGGNGADMLFGDLGADSLSGGGGDDSLYVDSTDTFIDGGAGFDAVYITSGPGMSFDMAAQGIEFVADFAGGNDTLNGATMAVDMTAYAGGGNDIITGGTGNDFLWGEAGADTITGNGGNDTLVGGTGADVLTGGSGFDNIYLNSGGGSDGAQDTVVFTAGWGTDFVFDFVSSEDKIDLTAFGTSFGALNITNSFGHAYIHIGAGTDLIAVAGNGGLLLETDFIF